MRKFGATGERHAPATVNEVGAKPILGFTGRFPEAGISAGGVAHGGSVGLKSLVGVVRKDQRRLI
jgi:hypothetical protein